MTAVLTHPRIDDLVAPRRPEWTPAELCTLTSRIGTELTGSLLDQVRFASPRRWWARLALTDEVEVWLLSWLPGQHTAPHDHGGAAGAFAVILGELSETYRYSRGPVARRTHRVGNAIGFGAGRVHQVWNTSAARAATVHAYSPPLVPTREYPSLDRPTP
ncbi:cysteine dioxygenase [Actinophytocola gossypii]|uniref:Cysteine dioxygenase family protein n=1 Tax=Actinophytocola gossypii TaxID=2812003 RepID=A0ABT2JBP8_9PSEU|nr:cysteine dioxygenase family protein [Actinophytocola gossypii]MCT2584989.1 cysteine dioxygenase family protein [Actinophytocola gossypii]